MKHKLPPLPARIAELKAQLTSAIDRMDLARDLITDGNPRPACNWGLLDTSDLRAQLASGQEPLGYLIEQDELDKLSTLADRLMGGSDRERDIGHCVWLILNRAGDLPIHEGDPAPAKQPLRDEQIFDFGPGQPDAVWSYEDQLYFARAIEAAHGIKVQP